VTFTGPAAELNLKFMWDLVGSLKFAVRVFVYVVDRGGRLLAFSDVARVAEGRECRPAQSGAGVQMHNPAARKPPWTDLYTGSRGATVIGTVLSLWGSPDGA